MKPNRNSQQTNRTPASVVAQRELPVADATPAVVHAAAPIVDTRIADVSAAWTLAIIESTMRAGLVRVDAPVVPQRARVNVGCKVALRDLFDSGDSYTLADLVRLTGKTEVNIRTQLSDMRSAKYAGKAGVYLTKSVRVGSVTRYSKA